MTMTKDELGAIIRHEINPIVMECLDLLNPDIRIKEIVDIIVSKLCSLMERYAKQREVEVLKNLVCSSFPGWVDKAIIKVIDELEKGAKDEEQD